MKHIVLACESFGAARAVGDYLEEHGYRVDIVEAGLKAFGFIKFSDRRRDRVDAVVTSVSGDESANRELLELLRREAPQLPVVVLPERPEKTGKFGLDTLLGKLAAACGVDHLGMSPQPKALDERLTA